MSDTEYQDRYFFSVLPTGSKIPLFYKYLQISPSYRAAHMHVEHGESEPDQSDFDRVLITYKDFGDVWQYSFRNWWYKYARKHFSPKAQSKPAIVTTLKTASIREFSDTDMPYIRLLNQSRRKLDAYIASTHVENDYPNLALIAVPLDGDKRKIAGDVRKLLEAEWPKTKSNETAAKYNFQKNKIRVLTLEKCLYTVHQMALNRDANDKSLVALGVKIKEKFEQGKIKGMGGENENTILRSQTSNMLAKTLNIAENAARGEFPKSTKNERLCVARIRRYKPYKGVQESYKIKFDYGFIADEIKHERMVTSAEKHTEENTAKKHNKIT